MGRGYSATDTPISRVCGEIFLGTVIAQARRRPRPPSSLRGRVSTLWVEAHGLLVSGFSVGFKVVA